MERKWVRFNWKRSLLGTAVSVVAMLALTGCGAWLLSAGIVDVEWMNYLAAGILLLSAFLGTAVCGAEPINGLVCAGGFWMVLMSINAVLFGCLLSGIWAVLATVLGGAGAGILLRMVSGGRRRNRRAKYRHR